MARPYSQDLRERVVAVVASGMSASAAARQFGISVSTAIRWSQRWRSEGHAKARPMGGDRRSRLKEHRVTLLTLIAEQPDMTIAEIRTGLSAKAGIQVSVGTICRFFALNKLTLKKKSLHATEQTRADVAEARHEFIKRQPSLDPERLRFLDETSATTKMTRTHGRCARGLRLISPIPHGHWKTTTLVMCLALTGVVAPYVIDGAMNGELFLFYVQQILAPCLSKGDILVLDNVPFHKVAGVREAVEARGARLLYLPPYSPDLNPIEKAFSKIKSFLRKEGARTKESLWLAIGLAVDKFNYTVCCNLFKCAGYAT